MNEVFLDTSFAIALSSITDQHHARAVQLAHQLQASQARLVTTQAILPKFWAERSGGLKPRPSRTALISIKCKQFLNICTL